jgi:hypothetical protein
VPFAAGFQPFLGIHLAFFWYLHDMSMRHDVFATFEEPLDFEEELLEQMALKNVGFICLCVAVVVLMVWCACIHLKCV